MPRLPEVDFPTVAPAAIVDLYLEHGCVLLRRFVDRERLEALGRSVAEEYQRHPEIGRFIFPRYLHEWGLPLFHECLFGERQYELLREVFRGPYRVSEVTASRRIDPTEIQGQRPLGPHLDAAHHLIEFTVNFWVPFRACDGQVPSLGVVRARFQEMAAFAGYNGGGNIGERDALGHMHYPLFAPNMESMWNSREPGAKLLGDTVWADRVWTPAYERGDAMMLSNWTLHFTHALAECRERRMNVEMRFLSNQMMPELVEKHRPKSVQD